MELTSRERLLRLFAGQDIDRVPIWLLAPFHRVPFYADIYNIDAYRPLVQAIEQHCDTFDRRYPERGFCYNVHPDIIAEPIATEHRKGQRVTYRDKTFERFVSSGEGMTYSKYFVTEPEDLDSILELPYLAPTPPLAPLQSEKDELGQRGLCMMDLGDPLEPLYHLCSAEDFSIWTLTDYEALLHFTDEMYKRVFALYKYYLDSNIPDAYFIVGAEFAGPPLVSPSKFGELCRRYVKGLVDLIRDYGKISIIHYHGQLSQVLDEFALMQSDGLHTIEAPPIGDCSFTLAREKLGRDMALIGNVQYGDLAHESVDEIRAQVKSIMDEAKNGKLILSPTSGPFDPTPSPKLIENYLAFIQAGIEHGKY